MGGTSSALFDVEEKRALQRLASKDVCGQEEWDLLSPRMGLRRWLPATPDVSTVKVGDYLALLKMNNATTGNFQRFVRETVRLVHDLPHRVGDRSRTGSDGTTTIDHEHVQAQTATNALFLVRKFAQYFIETAETEAELAVHFQDDAAGDGAVELPRALLLCLIDFCVINAPNDITYDLHVEVLNVLLVLLSTQMFQPLAEGGSPSTARAKAAPHLFLKTLMDIGSVDGQDAEGAKPTRTTLASAFVLALLDRFSARERPPADSAIVSAIIVHNAHQHARGHRSMTAAVTEEGTAPQIRSTGASSSLVKLATDLVLRIPMRVYEYFFPAAADGCPLSERAMMLLCMLVHNCREVPVDPDGTPPPAPWSNPFRACFVAVADDVQNPLNVDQSRPSLPLVFDWMPRLPFEPLFQSFGPSLANGGKGSIMLYSLMHANKEFKDFVLARDDLDCIVLPLLETMYAAPSVAPSHLYVILILLLMLSEDVAFNEGAHRRMHVPSVPWFAERAVSDISLGSLMLVMMLRTLQYNSTRAMDAFVHENCFAIISNMAPHVRGIENYCAQRVMSVVDVIGRRRKKREARAEVTEDETRLIVLLLELVATSLRPSMLPFNLELMYALVQRREVVDTLSVDMDTDIASLAAPLVSMVDFFENVVETERAAECHEAASGAPSPPTTQGGDTSTWTAEQIMEVLERGQRKWHQEMLAKNKVGEPAVDSKYAYEEVEHPESFFLPYIWSMVYDHTGDLWWATDRIVLFPIVMMDGSRPVEQELTVEEAQAAEKSES
jgi:hypothetical protein